MIVLEDRHRIAPSIQTAQQAGARLHKACEVVGIDVRTLQRWQRHDGFAMGDLAPKACRPTAAHA